MADLIKYEDDLRTGTGKLNASIRDANKAKVDSAQAVNTSNQAKQIAQQSDAKSDATQQQLDNIIIESGTSDAETIQARGEYDLLYQRLDASDAQLAQMEKVINVEQFKHLIQPLGSGEYDWTPAFEAAVAALSNNSKLVAPKNNYIITKKIVGENLTGIEVDFNNSNFIWKGEGFGGLYQGIFQFDGSLTDISTTVLDDEPEKTNTITVYDPSIFNVGDYVLIRTPDGSPSIAPEDIYNRYFAQIIKIEGNTLFINYRKRLGTKASLGSTVTKVHPAKNIKIKNFHVTAENQSSRENGMNGFTLSYCDNVSFENVSFDKLWFKGIKTTYCTNIELDGVSLDEPAARGGGEGYGIQFEYTHLSKIKKGRFNDVRHGTDCTASSHITIEDCVTTNGTNTSYTLHKAFEWDINYKNCYSIDDAQGGWANSSVNSGFGDTADDITLENCHAINAEDYGFSAVGLGSNFNLINSTFSVRLGSLGNAVHVVENNTNIVNCKVFGQLRVSKIDGATNDGFVRLTNSDVNIQLNNRALSLNDGVTIAIKGSKIVGMSDISSNSKILASESIFKTSGEAALFTILDNKEGIEYVFNNCELHLLGEGANTVYTFEGVKTIFNGVKFVNPNYKIINLKSDKIHILNGSEGQLRAVIDGVNNLDLLVSNNNFGESQLAKRIGISNSTGKALLDSNIITQQLNSNVAIDFEESNNIKVILKSNLVDGIVRVRGANSSIIKDNIIHATSVVFPGHDGTNHIVKDNVV